MTSLFFTFGSGRFNSKQQQQQAGALLDCNNNTNDTPSAAPKTVQLGPQCRLWPWVVKFGLLLLVIALLLCLPHDNQRLVYEVRVRRHQVRGRVPRLRGFVNDVDQYRQAVRSVHISVCPPFAFDQFDGLYYNFTITPMAEGAAEQQVKPTVLTAERCSLLWNAPAEGSYHVLVQSWSSSSPGHAAGSGSSTFAVHDLWLAVVGDSFAAGQGNPDMLRRMFTLVQPTWIDPVCCRSSRSYAYKVYEQLLVDYPEHNVLFTYLPCSGSSLRDGLLGPGANGVGQMSRLASLVELAGRTPDLLLLSIGGNDIGYSDVLMAMIWDEMKHLLRVMPRRLKALHNQLSRLSTYLQRLGMPPNRVLLTEYYDYSKNELGTVDANCSELSLISEPNVRQADEAVTQALNTQLATAAQQHNWTYTHGVYAAFETHGICAEANSSWILSPAASQRAQGNSFGAFHPNERGHRAVADVVYEYVRGLLKH